MPVLPKTRFARLLVAAWISLCIAVLVFGVIQRSIHDMPIAFTWFMLVLSAPVGLIIIPVIGMATSNASSALGVPYEPVLDLVPLWLAAVVFGYMQWFIAVPWLVRKVLRGSPGI